MRVLVLSALILGLFAGFVLLQSQPARALNQPSLVGSDGPVLFTGIDGLSGGAAGSFRVGKVPLSLGAIINAATLFSGGATAYPISCAVTWGDGAANVTSLASPLSSRCAVYHLYSVAGDYNLQITLSDVLGLNQVFTYPVHVYASSPAPVWYHVYIEGEGRVANLTRNPYLGQPIMAFIQNNGSNIMSGFTAYWYQNSNINSWSNLIYQASYSQYVFPGEQFPIAWPGNVPQPVTSTGTLYYWVKVVSGPRNITSTHFPVFYGSAPANPSISVQVPFNTVSASFVANYFYQTYTITNNGPMTVSLNDYIPTSNAPNYCLPPTGGANCAWGPSVLHSQFGTLINGSQQTVFTQNWPFIGGIGSAAINPAPPILDFGSYPATAMGVLLQPGESITLQQEVNPLSSAFASGSTESWTQTFTAYAAASCSSVTAGVPNCNIAGNTVSISNAISLSGGSTAASIQTVSGNAAGNGSVILTGKIISMGAESFLNTWFSFITPNGTVYTTSIQQVTSAIYVTAYLTGLPTGNYTFSFLATGASGNSYNGGSLGFSVGNVSSNPASNGASFTQGFLFGLAGAMGIPAVVLGYLFGSLMLFSGIIVLLFLQYAFDTEIPGYVWLPMLIIMMGVNVGLFLWPVWLAVILFVVVGLLLWRELSGEGVAGGEASG